MKKIKISPLSIIWAFFLVYFKTPYLIPLIFAVAIHELGHILIARILKIHLKSFEMSLLGARIESSDPLSYRDEFLLALGGPLFGFLGFALPLFPAVRYSNVPFCSDFLLPFSVISLCLTFFNLIPISIFDGGRMLKCVLCRLVSLDLAEKVLSIFTFLALFSMWLLSVYMILKTAAGLPMFIFCLIFFVKCFIFNAQTRENESF